MFACVYACVLKLVLLISEVLLKFCCGLLCCKDHSDAKSQHQALFATRGAQSAAALQRVCVPGCAPAVEGPCGVGLDVEGWACSRALSLPLPLLWKTEFIFLPAPKCECSITSPIPALRKWCCYIQLVLLLPEGSVECSSIPAFQH